ncbi:MAG: type II toxin-antitoxin system RelE/ParE family toxin [Patescibacteria group bacterium]
MYRVLIERNAERDLKRLPPEVFHRIILKIDNLSEDSRPPGASKLKGSKTDWKIRIGPYRVLYEIDDRAQLVKIFRVRHRREVYR